MNQNIVMATISNLLISRHTDENYLEYAAFGHVCEGQPRFGWGGKATFTEGGK